MSRLRKALWTSHEICTLLNNYEKNSPGFMRQHRDWTCSNLDLGSLSSELGRSEGAIIAVWWRFRDWWSFEGYSYPIETRFGAVCRAAIKEFSRQLKGCNKEATLTSEEKNMNERKNEPWTGKEIAEMIRCVLPTGPCTKNCTPSCLPTDHISRLASKFKRSYESVIICWRWFVDWNKYQESSHNDGSISSYLLACQEAINLLNTESDARAIYKYAVVCHTRIWHTLCHTKEEAEKAISKELKKSVGVANLSVLYAESGIQSFAITMEPTIKPIN